MITGDHGKGIVNVFDLEQASGSVQNSIKMGQQLKDHWPLGELGFVEKTTPVHKQLISIKNKHLCKILIFCKGPVSFLQQAQSKHQVLQDTVHKPLIETQKGTDNCFLISRDRT